jgi:ferric-dicitrate binding protein FerR (iron transport regulator)
MSDDRLEKALEAIKNEEPEPNQLADARARVWTQLQTPSLTVCAEFQSEIRDYLDGKLGDQRRLLMEDHLSRCSSCRTRMAEEKGERKPTPIQSRRRVRLPKWSAWAAAAALLISILYIGRNSIYEVLTQNSPRATVVSADGGLYLVPNGLLKPGATISEGQVVRTGPGAKARLRLSDGSQMDMNEGTELFLHAALSEKTINLQRGDVIVHAAKPRLSRLHVQTRDSIATVKGTIFAVSSGIAGTVVSVVEGSVAVNQAGSEVLLSPGEQAASNPALTSSVQRAVSWSPDAGSYVSILASLAHVQNEMAGLPTPSLSARSRLLQYIPTNTVLYGAIPNLGGAVNKAASLLEQQSAENPAFNQWWNSSASQGLKKLIASMQALMPLFGNEIVYGVSKDSSMPGGGVPLLFAEVQPGKQAELTAKLEEFRANMGANPFQYNLNGSFLAISDTQLHLQWLMNNLGQGSSTPFTDEIAARYQAGASNLLGIDVGTLVASSPNPASQLIGVQQMKYVFFEQRTIQGVEENGITLAFNGQRTGIGSFLASSGSGGAAEYISRDAIAAFYAATREPQQMLEEMEALFTRLDPTFQNNLALTEAKLGISLSNDYARAVGAESAFALEGLSVSGPVWSLAALVHDSSLLDNTIQRLIDFINAERARTGKTGRVAIQAENVNGYAWKTIKFPESRFTIVWTYDLGYIIAGSDRGAATRALATRNGGSPLIYSSAFQQQMPISAGLHPSGFLWLDLKSTLKSLPIPIPIPAIQKLIAEGEPILVAFNGTTEQISMVSRTRLSGLMTSFMLLGRSKDLGNQPAVR